LADASTRRQLHELMASAWLDDAALEHWRTLIVATGAVQWIEELIAERVARAQKALARSMFEHPLVPALVDMARLCTQRAT
jgi:geranylgeranyl diphosphate synthase type I